MFESLFRRSRASSPAYRALLDAAHYEIIPLKNASAQSDFLPAASHVSVTCSVAKGLEATLALTAQLRDEGHHAIPHIPARMVQGPDHVARLAGWFREHGIDEMFLVGGDAPEPGPYVDAESMLRVLLDTDHGLRRIGVTAYPDGHALIPSDALHQALHAKQKLLADAGVEAYASTQMCFDAKKIASWLAGERRQGLTIPIRLGVPGAVDRTKLLNIGMKLGVGQSMRFLKKNVSTIGRLVAPGGYDPAKLIVPLSERADELGIIGLHLFTFNSVDTTVAWHHAQAEL